MHQSNTDAEIETDCSATTLAEEIRRLDAFLQRRYFGLQARIVRSWRIINEE